MNHDVLKIPQGIVIPISSLDGLLPHPVSYYDEWPWDSALNLALFDFIVQNLPSGFRITLTKHEDDCYYVVRSDDPSVYPLIVTKCDSWFQIGIPVEDGASANKFITLTLNSKYNKTKL